MPSHKNINDRFVCNVCGRIPKLPEYAPETSKAHKQLWPTEEAWIENIEDILQKHNGWLATLRKVDDAVRVVYTCRDCAWKNIRPTCDSCVYWASDNQECKRRSPGLDSAKARHHLYPRIAHYGWCGEHPKFKEWLEKEPKDG